MFFQFLVLMVVLTSTLSATDGYFRHGYGIKYGALGGAGSALSLSSIGAATNPAALAFLENRYDISVALFSPDRNFEVAGNPSGGPGTFPLAPGKVESDSKYFPIPTLGANWRLNETMVIGAMIFANGGMNTDYPAMVFGDQSSSSTGVNLEQIFLGATYAIEVTKNHALGLTALLGYQRFSAEGLSAFGPFSSDAANLSSGETATSTGFGARVGYQGQVADFLRVGASYQLKMAMGEFDEYKGLFAEQGGFDIPSTWNVGIAVTPAKDFTVALDVKQIMYSEIKSIGNPINPMALPPAFLNPGGNPQNPMDYTPNPNHVPLGADEGSGFGWEDVMAYKVGFMYEGIPTWTFMAGFSIGENPIPETEVLFNILAPGVIENHITAGVTKQLSNTQEITVALMFAPASDVSGANVFEAPGQQTIKLEMSQWQLEIGYAFN